MSPEKPVPASAVQLKIEVAEPSRVEEIAAQVRLEYARYLEKRDAVRRGNGRLRRSMLHSQLAS